MGPQRNNNLDNGAGGYCPGSFACPEAAVAPYQPKGGHMHLLVVEDERTLCETIVKSLERLAYSVDFCFDGERALELLGTENMT